MWTEREFLDVFSALDRAAYYWEPLTPDRFLKARKNFTQFRPIERVFGLGLTESVEALASDGLPENPKFKTLSSPFSISRTQELGFLVHDFWPPKVGEDFIHIGPESFHLVREFEKEKSRLSKASVLDMGCSSGVLSFAASKFGAEVLGVDISPRSIKAATNTVKIKSKELKLSNPPLFFCKDVLSEDFRSWVSMFEAFDFCVFNPPLAVSVAGDSRPHRDGGKFGIEIPLQFLDEASRVLKKNGEAWFIIGNPIVKGKSVFDEKLKSKKEWKPVTKKTLEPYFNQAVALDHGYKKLGIDRIDLELWKLKKV